MEIYKPPNVLVIHLKRFSCEDASKITRPVLFRANMLLNCVEKGEVQYDLYGVIVHEGNTADIGHYIAYVKVRLEILRICF